MIFFTLLTHVLSQIFAPRIVYWTFLTRPAIVLRTAPNKNVICRVPAHVAHACCVTKRNRTLLAHARNQRVGSFASIEPARFIPTQEHGADGLTTAGILSTYSLSVGRVPSRLYLLLEPCPKVHPPLLMCNHHHSQSISVPLLSTMKIATFALFVVLLALVAVTKAGDDAEDAAERPLTTQELTGADDRLNTSVLRYGLQWEAWKVTHSRNYLSLVEELERFVIWRANQAFIDYHNSYAHKLGFTLRMNQFGDLVRKK